jgi:hypothetical protein
MDKHQHLAIERLLFKLANPLWRSLHIHCHSSEFEVYKPGSVSERFACLTRGDRLYLCLLYFSHDEYERDLPRRRIAEFDLARFEEWAPSAPADELETRHQYSLEQENRELLARLEQLEKIKGQKELEASEKSQARARGKVQGELTAAHDKIAVQNGKILDLEKQLAKCKQMLAQRS